MSLSKERAEELLGSFKTKRILVVGDAFVDTYVEGEIERLNPESHHVHLLRVGKGKVQYRSGGAGNTARNLTSLGSDTSLLTIRGNDKLGETLADCAYTEGYTPYTVADVYAGVKRPTIEKRRYVTKDGVLLRVDYEPEESTQPMSDHFVSLLLQQADAILDHVDAVLVSDYGKGMLTEKFCNEFLDMVQSRNLLLLADVKPRQAGHFVGVEMMAPNLKEASESLGKSPTSNPEEIASLLAKRLNTEVFLTAGEQGICVANKTDPVLMVRQMHRVKIGDTSGCGDTAAAAILLAKLAGATSEEAAEFANAAAAVTVSMVGAYAPTPAEVLRMLAS